MFATILFSLLGYVLIGVAFGAYNNYVLDKNDKFRETLLQEYPDKEQTRRQLDNIVVYLWPLVTILWVVTSVKLWRSKRAIKKQARVALKDFINSAQTPAERQYRINFVKYAKKQIKLQSRRTEWNISSPSSSE